MSSVRRSPLAQPLLEWVRGPSRSSEVLGFVSYDVVSVTFSPTYRVATCCIGSGDTIRIGYSNVMLPGSCHPPRSRRPPEPSNVQCSRLLRSLGETFAQSDVSNDGPSSSQRSTNRTCTCTFSAPLRALTIVVSLCSTWMRRSAPTK